jgi:hypothetical protein
MSIGVKFKLMKIVLKIFVLLVDGFLPSVLI